MEQTKANQYAEFLCQAMSQLIESEQARQSYDKTILCEIVDATNSVNGIYTVTDGSNKFNAVYFGSDYFVVGNKVYITIPMGDWSQQKTIIGKYASGSNTPINYTEPLNTMVDMLEDYPIKSVQEFTLNVNNGTIFKPIFQTNAIVLSEVINCNALGLSVDFKTNLSKDTFIGDYGVEVVIGYMKDGAMASQRYTLSADMLFGNPYNYFTWFNQTYKYDTSELKDIFGLTATFYVRDNTFKYYNNNIEAMASGTVSARNIWVQLGEDMAKLEESTFKIYTSDVAGDEDIDIKSIWLNKNEETNEFIGFSDGTIDTSYDEDAYNEELKNFPLATIYWSYNDPQGINSWNDADTVFARYKEVDEIYQKASELNDIIGKLMNATNASSKLYNFLDTCRVLKNQPDYKDDVFWSGKSYLVSDVLVYNNTYVDAYREYPTGPQQNDLSFFAIIVERLKNQSTVGSINTQFDNNNNLQTLIDNINQLDNEETLQTIANIGLKKDITELFKQWKPIYDTINDLLSDWNNKASIINTLKNELTKAGYVGQTMEEARAEYEQENANKYCVYWYKADASVKDTDPYLGAIGWSRIDGAETLAPAARASAETAPGMPAMEGDSYAKRSSVPLKATLDSADETSSYRAVVIKNHEVYKSNILTFTNKNPVIEVPEENEIGEISLELGDNAQDNYKLHNSYFILNNIKEKHLYRYLNLRTTLTKGQYLMWYLPTDNTMLKPVKAYLTGFTELTKMGITDTPNENSSDKELQQYEQWQIFRNRHSKEGYGCYVKDISDQTLSEELPGITMAYTIDNFFDYSARNNTIICRVVGVDGKIYDAERAATFTTSGTNGTDYTLTIGPVDTLLENDQIALIPEGNPLTLRARLYDANGDFVNNINYTWKVPEINIQFKNTESINLNNISLSADSGDSVQVSLAKNELNTYYCIVKVSTNYNGIELTAEYPIPVASNKSYFGAGPSMIVYDQSNVGYNVSDDGYILYELNKNELNSINNIKWEISYYTTGELSTLTNENANSASEKAIFSMSPQLIYTTTGGYRLAPPLMKPPSDVYYSANAYLDGAIIWHQPIRIITNQHASQFLNEWDGNLTIDEDNNIIMSSFVGAGTKDTENKFSGVVMGNLSKLDDGSTNVHGLYGYRDGEIAFSFTEDGKAVIGTGGKGQISIDGNAGVIKSGNYNESKPVEGMKIDLESGHIDAYNFKLTSQYINMDSENTGPIFTIKNPNYDLDDENSGPEYLVYMSNNENGLNNDSGSSEIESKNISAYFDIVNNTDYWFKENGGIYSATNATGNGDTNGTTAQTKLIAKQDLEFSFDYACNTEASYDKFTVTITNNDIVQTILVNGASGVNQTGEIDRTAIKAGETIVFKYVKDATAYVDGEKCEFSAFTIYVSNDTPSSPSTSAQYYLQSQNYQVDEEGKKTGVKFDLIEGSLDLPDGYLTIGAVEGLDGKLNEMSDKITEAQDTADDAKGNPVVINDSTTLVVGKNEGFHLESPGVDIHSSLTAKIQGEDKTFSEWFCIRKAVENSIEDEWINRLFYVGKKNDDTDTEFEYFLKSANFDGGFDSNGKIVKQPENGIYFDLENGKLYMPDGSISIGTVDGLVTIQGTVDGHTNSITGINGRIDDVEKQAANPVIQSTSLVVGKDEGFHLQSPGVDIHSSLNNGTYDRWLCIRRADSDSINDNETNRLLYIGPNNYYLQSYNYVKNNSGMKINLASGHIDAYDFKLTSGNILLQGGNNPQFCMNNPDYRQNNKLLQNILYFNGVNNNDDSYIASINYDGEENGFYLNLNTGEMRIPAGSITIGIQDIPELQDTLDKKASAEALKNVVIEGTSFTVGKDEGFHLVSNGVEIHSAINSNPHNNSDVWFRVGPNNDKLLYISDSDYYLQSNGYDNGQPGTRIDLADGSIISNNFALSAGKDKTDNNGVTTKEIGIWLSSDESNLFTCTLQSEDVLKVSESKYYLRSTGWKNAGTTTHYTATLKSGKNVRNRPSTAYKNYLTYMVNGSEYTWGEYELFSDAPAGKKGNAWGYHYNAGLRPSDFDLPIYTLQTSELETIFCKTGSTFTVELTNQDPRELYYRKVNGNMERAPNQPLTINGTQWYCIKIPYGWNGYKTNTGKGPAGILEWRLSWNQLSGTGWQGDTSSSIDEKYENGADFAIDKEINILTDLPGPYYCYGWVTSNDITNISVEENLDFNISTTATVAEGDEVSKGMYIDLNNGRIQARSGTGNACMIINPPQEEGTSGYAIAIYDEEGRFKGGLKWDGSMG